METEQKSASWASSKDAVPDWHTQVTIYDEADGQRVATVFRADAVPLIKAAPIMLEALRMVVRMFDGEDCYAESEQLARAAIAQAVNP